MIEVINLSKTFDDVKVLDNFNASFTTGANALMGYSGIGKTTLINIMLSLVTADSGEIKGLDNKKINCVFQEDRLINQLSPLKNVMLVCKNDKKENAKQLLAQLGLNDSINKPVNTASGGMKRRVAIARALVNKADIYIFDEAFKGLDDENKNNAIKVIKNNTKNAICIFITHDINDATLLDAKIINMQNK